MALVNPLKRIIRRCRSTTPRLQGHGAGGDDAQGLESLSPRSNQRTFVTDTASAPPSGGRTARCVRDARCMASPMRLHGLAQPLTVVVRAVYFMSDDGEPARLGEQHTLDVSTNTTLAALQRKSCEAIGLQPTGFFLCKGRVLSDGERTLQEHGLIQDPTTLYLYLYLILPRRYCSQEEGDGAEPMPDWLSRWIYHTARQRRVAGVSSPRTKVSRDMLA